MAENQDKKTTSAPQDLYFPANLAGVIDKDPDHPHLLITHNDPKSEVKNIFLPVPVGITLSDGASYEGLDRGDFKAAEAFTKGGADVASDGDKLALGLRTTKNLPGFDKVSAELMLKNRIATNPMTEMTFNGNSMRTLSLSFAMTPRNQKEAEVIRDIVNAMRRFMYAEPTGNSGYTVQYPAQFKLEFMAGEKPSQFFPIFFNSYLTSLQTNYGSQAGGFIKLDGDAMYQQHSITMEFAESKLLTRKELYGDTGSIEALPNTEGLAPAETNIGDADKLIEDAKASTKSDESGGDS